MNTGPKDIKSIFAEAIEKKFAKERAAFLDEACGDDADLRSKVEGLLKAHSQAGDFLEEPAIGASVTLGDPHMTEGPGTIVGRYKLLEKIGEGGMAVVYMAEQKEPIRRKVALKVIKLGMDTKQVIARFAAERQALAIMDHPNIAKVLDAGATETGRPYFVMELVKGVCITEYCDKNKLNTRERLDLFIQVCNAVQHAHQKGIIHRDIKPSNIMVTLHDGQPVPKVIDFGIAKATSLELTEKTLFTRYAQMIGTPEYMSPEQAEISGLDIDTRTDIYSLGVLLYQLLTGTLPFDPEKLRSAGYAEIRRTIVEDEPPKPSTRLSSLGEEAKKVAESRRTEISLLVARLRKELEWIPLKAIRKDRTRRYRSAAEMSDDVQNYLSGAPLIAGPESSLYRLKKSIHRNRTLMTGVAAVTIALVAGIVTSTVLAISADRSRAEAERQAMISQAVADFLTDDLLGSVAPEKAKSPEVTVHSVLDAASKSLEGRFEGKPLIEASIREKLGETYEKLGDYDSAEPHLERAYQIRATQLGEEDLSTLTSMNHLGSLYFLQARYDDAEPLLVVAWQIRSRLLGEEHPHTLASAVKVAWLSFLSVSLSDNAVEDLFVKTREAGRRVLGDEHSVTLEATRGLATLYYGTVRYDEAEPLCADGLEITRRLLSEEHEATLGFMNLLAMLHCQRGRYGQGTPLVTRALQIGERMLGKEHPTTIRSMFVLGELYRFQDRYDDAEPLLQESVQLSRQVLGDEHFWTLYYMHHLAYLYRDRGRYDDAGQLLVKVIEGRLHLFDESSGLLRRSITDLANMYADQGRHNAAEQLLTKALERRRRLLGEKHGHTQACITDLCLLYEMSGQFDKLKALFLKRFEKQRPALDEDDAALAGHLNGRAWRQATHPAAEVRNGPEAIENATKACELTNGQNPEYVDTLAAAYAEVGDFASAIEWQKKAIDLLTEEPRPRSDFEARLKLYESGQPARESYIRTLAWLNYRQGQYEGAERLLIRALEFSRRVFGEEHPETRACLEHFVRLYEAWDKPEKAEHWRAKLLKAEQFKRDLEALQKQHGIPGMSVAVVRKQKIIFAQGFGYADLENRIPATQNTPYNIASCTKPFAGVLLMKLVEEGKLDLDAAMSDVLKDKLFPIRYQGKEIRGYKAFCDGIRDIMQDSSSPLIAQILSGFRDYRGDREHITVRHLLTHTAEDKPGTRYQYNGDVYSLLSFVAEEASGKRFDELLVETIVSPLKMSRTVPSMSKEIRDEVLADRTKYYRLGETGDFVRADVERPVRWPKVFQQADLDMDRSFLINAGAGIVTTVLDLAKFDVALDQNRIISGATKEMMLTPSRSNTGQILPYALGWFVQDWKGKKLVWHYGYHGYYSSLILKVPVEELTLILLTNSGGASAGFKLGGGTDPENVLKSPFAAAFVERFTQSKTYPGEAWKKAKRPEDLGWSSEKLAEAKAYSKWIGSAAVMIVDDGVVVDSWGDTARKYHCHSMRKSLVSALYGIYAKEGKIKLKKTLKELGVDDNTPLRETEREATIADLLKARSGVYLPALGESSTMKANRPVRGSHSPDTFWYYNNWDFNALGTIFDQETREESIYSAFTRHIADPMGFQDFNQADHQYHYESYTLHPYYGFRMSTRDLARVGLLFLRGGCWQDKQILPSDWVRESTASHSTIGPDSGYGYMWWTGIRGGLFPNVNVTGYSYYASGAAGHWIIVLPYRNLVIIHRVDSDKPGAEVYEFQMGTLLWLILASAGETGMGESPRIESAQGDRLKAENLEKTLLDGVLKTVIAGREVSLSHAEDGTLALSIGRLVIPAKWWVEGDKYCNDLPSGMGGSFYVSKENEMLKLYDLKGFLFLRLTYSMN